MSTSQRSDRVSLLLK